MSSLTRFSGRVQQQLYGHHTARTKAYDDDDDDDNSVDADADDEFTVEMA